MEREIPLRDEPMYQMVELALSEDKIASISALRHEEEESHLAESVRQTLIMEITIRALALAKLEEGQVRISEADIAVEHVTTAASLAEARARVLWRRKRMSGQ